MCCEIIRVCEENYSKFEDMINWRVTGCQREPLSEKCSADIARELENPNLYVYAALYDAIFVGWIALVYLPKLGKYDGHGHVYVDELWVAPSFRRRGYAAALLRKADDLMDTLSAVGVRLYVNTGNPDAQRLI